MFMFAEKRDEASAAFVSAMFRHTLTAAQRARKQSRLFWAGGDSFESYRWLQWLADLPTTRACLLESGMIKRGFGSDGIAGTELTPDETAEVDAFLKAFVIPSRHEELGRIGKWTRMERQQVKRMLTERLMMTPVERIANQGDRLLVQSNAGSVVIDDVVQIGTKGRVVAQYGGSARRATTGARLAENIHPVSLCGLSARCVWDTASPRNVEDLVESIWVSMQQSREAIVAASALLGW